jgi:hypothetical protein
MEPAAFGTHAWPHPHALDNSGTAGEAGRLERAPISEQECEAAVRHMDGGLPW